MRRRALLLVLARGLVALAAPRAALAADVYGTWQSSSGNLFEITDSRRGGGRHGARALARASRRPAAGRAWRASVAQARTATGGGGLTLTSTATGGSSDCGELGTCPGAS